MTEVQYIPPVYLPDGRPAPFLMTLEELVDFLRLNVNHPRDTVDRMRRVHGLRSVQVSKRVLYQLPDVLDFLQQEQERNPR